MGHEGQDKYLCYMMQGNTVLATIEAADIDGTLEVETAEDVTADTIKFLLGQTALEMTIRIPKMWKCGSRKRFIRLLMSYGCDRNTAEAMTATVLDMQGRKSYQQLLFETLFNFAKWYQEKE